MNRREEHIAVIKKEMIPIIREERLNFIRDDDMNVFPEEHLRSSSTFSIMVKSLWAIYIIDLLRHH